MNSTPRRRAGASTAKTRRQAAAPAANTGGTNAQVPLFGPAVVQQVIPSPEQVALKRQRLTTSYDPLNPPEDDPTTAEGVRMGVVTDHDGRHWRQQSMRLGRWITTWKDTSPFPSEPVDVDELTKREKSWLDIKFRRRLPVRRTPAKMAPGRGCTGRYWSLRRGNRGFQRIRVSKASGAPPSTIPAARKDDNSEQPSGGADDPDDVFGMPRLSFYQPLRDSTDRRRNPVFTGPLISNIMAHFGVQSDYSEALESQLCALLPDDLFAHDVFTEEAHYPRVKDIPSAILTKMGGIIRAAGLVTTEPAVPRTSGLQPQPDKMQQATIRARERQQFEKDILSEAGLTYNDLPSSFRREMTKSISSLQNAGRELKAGLRSAAASAALGAVAAAAAATAAAAAAPAPGPVFVEPVQAATAQNRYWAEDKDGNVVTHPTNVRAGRRCYPDQAWRIRVQKDDDLSAAHVWVAMRDANTGQRVYVRDDRTDGYMDVGRRSPEPTRQVQLKKHDAVFNMEESRVGTSAFHAGLVINGCLPEVNDLEEPSTRLVAIIHEGQRISVPYNKLGSYVNAKIADAPEIFKVRNVRLSPEDPGPDLVSAQAMVGVLPEHTNATILSCEPDVDDSEPASQRLVKVRYNGVEQHVPDNKLGSYIGGLVNPSDEVRNENARKGAAPFQRAFDLYPTGTQQGGFAFSRAVRANDTTQTAPRGAHASLYANAFKQGKTSTQSNIPEQGRTFTQSNISGQAKAPVQSNVAGQAKASTQGKLPMQENIFGQDKTTIQNKNAGQSRTPTQSSVFQQVKTPTQGKTVTQGNNYGQVTPSTQSSISGQGKSSSQGTISGQYNVSMQETPPSQAKVTLCDSDDAETNVDYPVSMNAPEFISPSFKKFPNGRPDKDGNLPQPRPPRGDPDEVERLRLARDRMIRREAVSDYIAGAGDSGGATTNTGRPASFGSIVGAVTVRAGSGPATTAAQQRPKFQSTSRADVQARKDVAPPNTQPQVARTTTKSSRVVKPGRGAGAGVKRSVRFASMPTEEEIGGRARGSGLRTRSGALYGLDRKSGKGI